MLALVAVRWRWTYEPLAGVCSVLYAIPSLALFGVLVSIPFFGLGYRTAEVALVSYTLLILLRNIVAGLDGVPPAVREAADGMGYERWRRVLRVDLPLATPSIVAGLRIATVTTVGLVTVTSLVGEGGFGKLINDGLVPQLLHADRGRDRAARSRWPSPSTCLRRGRVADHAVDEGEGAHGRGPRRTRADEVAETSPAPPRPRSGPRSHARRAGRWFGERAKRANHEHSAVPGPKGRASRRASRRVRP